jgi:predicted secreted protein
MLSFPRPATALLIGLAASIAPAAAQTPPVVSNATVLHLTETAERNVVRDRLRVDLAAEISDPDAAKVQAEINRRMTAALTRINSVPDIAVETNGYTVYQDRPANAPPRWHGSQSVSLVAKDFTALLALVGTLQQNGLVITGLAPELSHEAEQSVEDELTDNALARLQKRAAHIAATLGTTVDAFRDVRIGNAGTPPPVTRAMALSGGMSQSAPPPVAEPGEATVRVMVQADIALK